MRLLKFLLHSLGFILISLSWRHTFNEKVLMSLFLVFLTILRYFVGYLIQASARMYLFLKTGGVRISTDKNTTPEQLIREDEWDVPFSFGSMGLGMIYTLTPLMTDAFSQYLSWNQILFTILSAFITHITLIEFVYYIFHVSLHRVKPMWYRMHSYHHKSIHTEPLTGNVQDPLEHLLYTINFAPALVACVLLGIVGSIPWWIIVGYIISFDVMNTIGHLNVEIFPRWWIKTPLKYLLYTPTFHSLHHTHFICNYSLFIPMYDLIFGTYSDKYT